jgi:hypothetical protein
MIPLRDDNPSSTTPVVTRLLILLNVAAFVYELTLGPDLKEFVYDWGLVPVRLTLAFGYHDEHVGSAVLSIFTSMFIHGGFAHIIGNMWYLWIFGDNVEDRFGHFGFLLFYLAAGVVAAIAHYATNMQSQLPTVGASGAIAGVLGAYLVAYPRARVITLVPLFPFVQVVALPAMVVLGLWFVFQFFSGALTLGTSAVTGGVAFWAHVGGFAFGALAMKIAGGGRRSAS